MLVQLSAQSGHFSLELKIAETQEELYKAFRLRYEVFVKEEGARLSNFELTETDEFDNYCDHLIVVDLNTGDVVGTYRLLPGNRAVNGIGFYSQGEFDMSQFSPWFKQTVELGRSCVKQEFRTGKVISLLWEGIGQYLLQQNFNYLIGCASLPAGIGTEINEIYTYLKNNYKFNEINVEPHPQYQMEHLHEIKNMRDPKIVFRNLPPLIKGYLRLGANICGKPAFDPLFQTIDFFMILDKNNIVKRYKNNYLKAV